MNLFYLTSAFLTGYKSSTLNPHIGPQLLEHHRRRLMTLGDTADSNRNSSNYGNYGNRASLLQRNDGILYRTSVFDNSELETIRRDLASFSGRMVDEAVSSIATRRLGATLAKDSATSQILREGSLTNWVNAVATDTSGKNRYVLCDDNVPVEIRSYECRGACMAWHRDDVLFGPQAQLEVVWTLENTSDCVTMWKSSGDENICTVETDPNSALLIVAGGPSHCVTSLRRGRRVILKCVYALEDAVFLKDNYQNQFYTTRRKRKKTKSRQK